jgi:hypothetical protein
VGDVRARRGQGKISRPVSGCLYYQPQESDEKESVKKWTHEEWAQLRKLAGKREVVGFGFCHSPEQAGKVHRDVGKDDVPDTYPLGSVEVVTRAEDWQAIDPEAIKGLLKATAPRAPAPTEKVPPKKNKRSTDARRDTD